MIMSGRRKVQVSFVIREERENVGHGGWEAGEERRNRRQRKHIQIKAALIKPSQC